MDEPPIEKLLVYLNSLCCPIHGECAEVKRNGGHIQLACCCRRFAIIADVEFEYKYVELNSQNATMFQRPTIDIIVR